MNGVSESLPWIALEGGISVQIIDDEMVLVANTGLKVAKRVNLSLLFE